MAARSTHRSTQGTRRLAPAAQRLDALRLEQLLEVWQERLRLQDWTVRIRFAQTGELDESAVSEIDYNREAKVATVLVRASAELENLDRGDDFWILFEDLDEAIEACVIHELLHLHTAPFSPAKENTAEHTAMEVAIHALALAFARLSPSRK